MQSLPLRALIVASCIAVTSLVSQSTAPAQSRLDLYGGLWTPFLPDYEAISIVGSGGSPVLQRNLFNDNQSDVGMQVGLRGLRGLNQSGKMMEFDFNVAGIDSLGSTKTFADPDATSSIWMSNFAGNFRLASPDNTTATFSLDSDVIHYSEYIGLRDRFRRNGGTLDLGLGFSHMGFQQNFQLVGQPLNGGLRGEYDEDLDTNYYGGELRATRHKYLGNTPIHLDFALGIYDMNADYEGTSRFFNNVGAVFDQARVADSIDRTAASITVGARLDRCFRGVLVRPGINFKYISHMASINHPQANILLSNPDTLGTKPGWFLGLNVEILLCCRSRCCCN